MGHKSYQCPKNEEATGYIREEESPSKGSGGENSSQESPSGRGPGNYVNPGEQHGHRPARGGHYMPPPYQPYQFHPRPLFQRHTRDREQRDRPERGEGGAGADGQPRRALEDVVCYKVSIFLIRRMCGILELTLCSFYKLFQCGYKGHYANKCDKGKGIELKNTCT